VKKQQLELQLTLPVRVSFELLPRMLVEGQLLPDQIDILEVLLEIPDKNGKLRNVNILPALEESAIMLLEDDVLNEL